VPLIVRDPRLPERQRGTTKDPVALNIDVAPTIPSAAGVAVPEVMQGRDLGPLYLSRTPLWRDKLFYEHPTITSRDRILATVIQDIFQRYHAELWRRPSLR